MYKEVREAWLAEQKETAIRPLNNDFFGNATEYLKQLESTEGEIPELLKVKKERVKYMLMDLLELRLEKMFSSVIAGVPLNDEALTQRERIVYDDLRKLLRAEEDKLEELGEEEFVIVRLLVDLPEIVGADLQTYGPFKAEDVATLPRENAAALIKRGAAIPIITDNKGGNK